MFCAYAMDSALSPPELLYNHSNGDKRIQAKSPKSQARREQGVPYESDDHSDSYCLGKVKRTSKITVYFLSFLLYVREREAERGFV